MKKPLIYDPHPCPMCLTETRAKCYCPVCLRLLKRPGMVAPRQFRLVKAIEHRRGGWDITPI